MRSRAHAHTVFSRSNGSTLSTPRHPIQVVLRDPSLERNRLTVAFRLLLAIPHFIWWFVWGLGAAVVLPIAWVWALIEGGLPEWAHRFYAAFVRYTAHLYAYTSFAADPYPGFLGDAEYPVDVEIAPREPQRRWTIALRLLLALPPLLLASVLLGGLSLPGGSGDASDDASAGAFLQNGGGVLVVVAFLAWFACLVRGRMPAGFRDLLVWIVGYAAQAHGYLVLLTERYPDSSPALARPAPMPPHPVTVRLDDDLRRSRLTVGFRVLLAIPHFVWLTLWGIPVVFAVIANWVATLAIGRPPAPLHRFLSAYIRYRAHVTAFVFLVSNPFPGFLGRPGSYPLDVEIDPPASQHRAVTLFRLVLGIPAWLVVSALSTAVAVAAIGGWFASLATGRMPRGLRDIGAFVTRYQAQVDAYAMIVTDRYPYSGPTLEERTVFLPPVPETPPEGDWRLTPEAV
jgi:hypothetical protein